MHIKINHRDNGSRVTVKSQRIQKELRGIAHRIDRQDASARFRRELDLTRRSTHMDWEPRYKDIKNKDGSIAQSIYLGHVGIERRYV